MWPAPRFRAGGPETGSTRCISFGVSRQPSKRRASGRSWGMVERGDRFEVRRVAIVTKPGVSEGYFERLVAALEKRSVEISEVRPDDEPDGTTEPDLVFVLGGDGTMLRATRMFPGRVLLGVNLGKVGFMSGMLPEEIETGVEKVFDGGLEVQEYRMLEVRLSSEEPRLAANDAVLIKKRPHQIISVDVRVSGEELFAFRCDGFIAATPLGSTAYALSAGGPIISGDAGCYVLVPIAPHALVSRPLVLGEDQVAEFRLVGRDAFLTLDGEEPREIPAGERVEIKLSRESVKIGRTEDWGGQDSARHRPADAPGRPRPLRSGAGGRPEGHRRRHVRPPRGDALGGPRRGSRGSLRGGGGGRRPRPAAYPYRGGALPLLRGRGRGPGAGAGFSGRAAGLLPQPARANPPDRASRTARHPGRLFG